MFSERLRIIQNWYAAIPPWVKVYSILGIITLIGAGIRFHDLGKQSLWGDEIDTMLFVHRNVIEMFYFLWPKEMNMSLFYLFIHFWQYPFHNPSESILRIVPAMFSIISIPAVFFLGRALSADKRFGNVAGIVAALLLSINSFHIEYAQELRSYSLTFLVGTLSTILLIKAVGRSSSIRLWFGYVFVSAAGMYCHDFIAFLLVAHIASLSVLLIGNFRKFPYVPIFVSYASIGILSIPMLFAARIAGTGGLIWVPAPTLQSALNFLFDIAGNAGMLLITLHIIAISIVFFEEPIIRVKNSLVEKWPFILVACCMILPVTIITLVSVYGPHIFVERYFIIYLPFLAISGAMGISRLFVSQSKTGQIFGAVLLAAMLILSALGTRDFFAHNVKEDWRGASVLLSQECSSPEHLRLYYPAWSQGLASYYDPLLKPQDLIAEGAISDQSHQQVLDSIFETGKYSEVCLILSQQANIKSLNFVTDTLIKRFPSVTTSTFQKIQVYIYR